MLRFASDSISRLTVVALLVFLELKQFQLLGRWQSESHLNRNAIYQLANAETVPIATPAIDTATSTADDILNDALFIVDTKYWLRSTEFGERDNWRAKRKPCTLLERIKLNEQAVVSIGDSMDALSGSIESNIKELSLPMNGIFLLEEDTFGASIDPNYIQFLNESGDCYDSVSSNEQQHQGEQNELFYFEPESDQMSWFNPDNWVSAMLGDETVYHLNPESHLIPCMGDVVIFGDRSHTLSSTIEASERSKSISFKVNFRPSQAVSAAEFSNIKVNNIRVSRLQIGDQIYNQKEFEQLISSKQYENILFEFNNSLNILRVEDGFAYSLDSLFTIDETSVVANHPSRDDVRLDPAGNLCGNEGINVMKTVCSFHEPLKDSEFACYDPISSAGYCNKICATSISFNIDPTKFEEKFVFQVIARAITRYDYKYTEAIFGGARRTSEDKYEVTFRPVKSKQDDNEYLLGKISLLNEIAQFVFRQLNEDATRTVYGIGSVSVRSSVKWKYNNSNEIFWISFAALSLLSVVIFIRTEGEKLGSENNIVYQYSLRLRGRFVGALRGRRAGARLAQDESESFVRYSDPAGPEDSGTSYVSASNIPLARIDSQEPISFA